MSNILSFRRISICGCIALACLGFATVPASAASTAGSQCGARFIAKNIQSAVLALKATQHCGPETLPYSRQEVWARLDSLRCSEQSSTLINSLINDYDQQYKLIMTKDFRRTICHQAMSITLN